MKLSQLQLDTIYIISLRGCVPGAMLHGGIRRSLVQRGLIQHVQDKGYIVTDAGREAIAHHSVTLSLR